MIRVDEGMVREFMTEQFRQAGADEITCSNCGHERVFHLRSEEHWFGLLLKTFPIPCVICPPFKVCGKFLQEKK